MAEITPGFDITLPKRGKLRVTTVEEADEIILTASAIKEGILAARAAVARVMAPAPEPLPRRTPGSTLASGDSPAVVHDLLLATGITIPGAVVENWTQAQRREAAAWAAAEHLHASDNPVERLPEPAHVTEAAIRAEQQRNACGAFTSPGLTAPDAPPPDECLFCGYPKDAHEPADDGPEPYHATSGPKCGVTDGTWMCTAQRGHGGPDHIAYSAFAEGGEAHRWPVADDYHPSRRTAPAGNGQAPQPETTVQP